MTNPYQGLQFCFNDWRGNGPFFQWQQQKNPAIDLYSFEVEEKAL
jgi:hypothetical protein